MDGSGSKIYIVSPLFLWEESKSQPPNLEFTQASEQLVAELYVGVQDPSAVAV